MMKESETFNSIYGIEEFVRNCHAKVEDEVVFPTLRRALMSENMEETIAAVLNRLEADHKLIDKIGEQIRVRTVEGDRDILAKRISLYCSTVETHNTVEERQIFPYWGYNSAGQEQTLRRSAMNIVRDFGLNRYYEVTGFSEELLNMFYVPT
jgi:hemerythrin superfamily protein